MPSDTRERAKEIRAQARELAKQRKRPEALALYDEAITLWPRFYTARHSRALLLRSMKRVEDANKALRLLVEEFPERDLAYIDLIAFMIDARQVGEAERLLDQLRQFVPDAPALSEQEARVADARAHVDQSRRPVGDYVPWRRILTVNEAFNGDFRKTPGKLLNNLIRAAMFNECYETAIGIAEYTLATIDGMPDGERKLAVGGCIEALVAAGRTQEAWQLLKANPTVAGLTDALISFFCSQVARDVFDPSLAVGASGKLNSYYISQMMDAAGAYPLVAAMRMPDVFERNPQNFLLLASYHRERDHVAYIEMINRFLRSYGAGLLRDDVDTVPAAGDVLARFRFRPEPPVDVADAPLVSVIMATRNASATIAHSIESILAQSHGKLELLVCDDASTDDTRQIIQHYAALDPRVRVFGSEAGQGPYNIRNHLIARAEGAFITFQDSDDVSFPTRLAVQLRRLLDNPAEWGVAGRWVRVRSDGSFVFFRDGFALQQCTVSLMSRREAFDRFGTYDQVRFGGDSDFIERIRVKEGQAAVHVMPRPVMFGLWSDGSLTRSAGAEIDESGYRSPTRRHYAELKMRERLRGGGSDDPLRMQNHIPPSRVSALAPQPL